MAKAFFIKTFGCQMNLRDSEIMAQTLSSQGYVESMSYQDADLIILNTCSIRAKAEQKVLSLLGYLRKTKSARPGMALVVAGCVAQQEGARLLEKMPHVDLVIGTQHIYGLPALLEAARQGGPRIVTALNDGYEIPSLLPPTGEKAGKLPLPHSPRGSHSRFVTIMQGCNNFCSYCVVPYTRGREVSRQVNELLEEVEILVKQGAQEITLLGQNVNSYGKTNDIGRGRADYSFPDLLREVSAIAGLRRLRFTTSNPKDFGEELMRCFGELPNLCPQLHLPVQSGSDRILKLMNRRYSVREYLDKVERLRQYCPGITLTTDIIVGFPGETEVDFQETMELLDAVRYHGSFSFKYSDRKGTKASGLTDKLDERVKGERLTHFQRRQDEISLERNREYVGTTMEILIEEVVGRELRGRTVTDHIVHVKDCPAPPAPGESALVTITHAGQHSLSGEWISQEQ